MAVRAHLDDAVDRNLQEYGDENSDAKEAKKHMACKVILYNKRRGREFIKSTRDEIEIALRERDAAPAHEIEEVTENLSPIAKHLSTVMKLIRLK